MTTCNLTTELNNIRSWNNASRSWYKKNSELYQELMNYPGNSFNEKAFLVLNGYSDIPECPVTGEKLEFINITSGHRNFGTDVTHAEILDYLWEQEPEFITEKEIKSIPDNHYKVVGSFIRNNLDLIKKILHSTDFLPYDSTISERVYCLKHSINCNQPDKSFQSYNRGYCNKREKFDYSPWARLIDKEDQDSGKTVWYYIDRNKNRDTTSWLYDLPKSDEGDKFVVCPVLGLRMRHIKSTYIQNVLQMPVEEFESKFHEQLRIAPDRNRKVSEEIHRIDEETGLPKYQIAQQKAKEKLQEKGNDGLTGYERKGKKTRQTHMNKVDEWGRNGYLRNAIERNNKILDNGLTVQQNALIKKKEKEVSNGYRRGVFASRMSKDCLHPILEWLDSNALKYYFDKSEYAIRDTKNEYYYYFDLVIPDFEIAIEFQSNAYHPNPFTWTQYYWNNWTDPFQNYTDANEKYEYDQEKAYAIYRERGYKTFFVYQDTYQKDVEVIMEHLNEKK